MYLMKEEIEMSVSITTWAITEMVGYGGGLPAGVSEM